MLYTININQQAAISSGLPLKVQHLAVIAVIRHMLSSSSIEEVWHDGHSYKWIALQVICDELPIFDFEKRRVSQLITELEECNVIERHPDNQRLRKSFFRAGSNWDMLFSSMQNNADIVCKKLHSTMQKNADNHNTNNQYNSTTAQSENFLAKAVEENRQAIAPYQNLKQLQMPASIAGEKTCEAWGAWLDDQAERGRRVTRIQAESLINNLASICSNEQEAVNTIIYSLNGGYPKFYDGNQQPKSNGKNTSQQSKGYNGQNGGTKTGASERASSFIPTDGQSILDEMRRRSANNEFKPPMFTPKQ